nr:flavin reductase family protein [Candidatus Sigynarchaeota archaeon]
MKAVSPLELSKLPEKVVVDVEQHVFMVYPRQSVLITSGSGSNANITTAAWSTPLSCKPPLQGVVISPKRLTHQLISEQKKFVIAIPSREIIKQVIDCGRSTGRTKRKFEAFNLTPLEPLALGHDGPPRIAECPVNIECELRESIVVGENTMFVGEVIAASSDKEHVTPDGLYIPNQFEIPYHLGGHQFTFNNLKTYSY